MKEEQSDRQRCSFCKKDTLGVRKLIAGPGVYICDECVDVCVDIFRHDVQPTIPKLEREASAAPRWSGGNTAGSVRALQTPMPRR